MGSCQCVVEPKETTAVLNIGDPIQVPSSFEGSPDRSPESQNKKKMPASKTLGVMPSSQRHLEELQDKEMAFYDQIRSKTKRKRLGNEAIAIGEGWKENTRVVEGKKQSEEDFKMITEVLKRHFAFGEMSSEEM